MITGEQLIAFRKSRKLSRKAFAELTGLTQTKIHNIEHGREVRPEEWSLIAPHLGNFEAPSPDVTVGETPRAADTPPSAATANGDGASLVIILGEDEELLADDGELDTVLSAGVQQTIVNTLRTITNSEVQTFKRCRRKWWLGWYRGLALKQAPATGAREIGTRVHAALAAWYQPEGQSRVDPREALESVLLEDWNAISAAAPPDIGIDVDTVDRFKKESDLVRAMIEGYVQWITESGVDAELEIIGSEQVVAGPLLDDVAVKGKLDVRARRTTDNATLFMDHKTVGNFSEPLRTLHLDEQMMHYMLLEMLNIEPEQRSDGALYNMLRKVKRTATATPPFYERVEVRHNPQTIQSFRLRLIGTVEQILDAQGQLESGRDPNLVCYPSPRRDCSWDCDFLAICSMFDDGSRAEDFISEIYKQVNPLERYGPDTKDV